MITTSVGQVVTHAGLAQQYDTSGNPDPFRLPASAFRVFQPRPLPASVGHVSHGGWQVGEVALLVRGQSIGLLAFSRIDADVSGILDQPGWCLSGDVKYEPTATPLEYGQVRLREVAHVRNPAAINTRPSFWRASDISVDSGMPAGLPLSWQPAWRLAHKILSAPRHRHQPDPPPFNDPDVELMGRGVHRRLHPLDAALIIRDLDLPAPAPPTPTPRPPAPSQRGGAGFDGTGLVKRRTYSNPRLVLR